MSTTAAALAPERLEEESRLITRIGAGDARAMETIMRRHNRLLHLTGVADGLLVADRSTEGPVGAGEDTFDCFLVPIDTCYELVGHLRRQWRGFDGGQEVRERLRQFFDDLRTRSRPVRAGQGA